MCRHADILLHQLLILVAGALSSKVHTWSWTCIASVLQPAGMQPAKVSHSLKQSTFLAKFELLLIM